MIYWTILKKLVPYLLAAALGAFAAWEIQSVRIGHLNNQLTTVQHQLAVCGEVNNENTDTISQLKKERENINTVCLSRLGDKEKLISQLKTIDNLGENKNENATPASGNAVTDPILRKLNGMFATGATNSQN